MQDSSENGYELAGLEQPVDINDDDEAIVETVDQFVFQNMYTEVVNVGGDNDDSVEAALGLLTSMYMCIDIAVLTSLPLGKLAAMHSAAGLPKKIHLPAQKNFAKWAAQHPAEFWGGRS